MTVAYSDEVVKAGLLAIIATLSYEDAAKALETQGMKVDAKTLSRWAREDHVVEYEKLREQWAPKIEAQLANNFLDNARAASEAEREAIDRSMIMLKLGKAQDPSRMARDLSQVKSQSVDKRLALQGRPTQITERRDIRQIVNKLQQMGAVKVIESTATVLPDGE